MVLYVTLGPATIRVIPESDLGSIAMTALRKDIYIYTYIYVLIYFADVIDRKDNGVESFDRSSCYGFTTDRLSRIQNIYSVRSGHCSIETQNAVFAKVADIVW